MQAQIFLQVEMNGDKMAYYEFEEPRKYVMAKKMDLVRKLVVRQNSLKIHRTKNQLLSFCPGSLSER